MASHLPILGTFLAIAAAADVAQRRVPNGVVAPLAVAGVAAKWEGAGAGAAVAGILAGVAVVAVSLYPWRKGIVGAGDVKLAAAVAIWVGPDRLVPFLLFAGAAGLPVAIAARVGHRLALRRLVRAASASGVGLEAVAPPRESVPFAVAIALGALAVVLGGAS
jgi:prepilin peptidase CpaA